MNALIDTGLLLDYLKGKNHDRYAALIGRLGLRR